MDDDGYTPVYEVGQLMFGIIALLLVISATSPVGSIGQYWLGEQVPDCEVIVGTVVEIHNYTAEGHNLSEEPWIHSNWAIVVQVNDEWAGTSEKQGVWVTERVASQYEIGDMATEIICEVKEHQSLMQLFENMTANGWLWSP